MGLWYGVGMKTLINIVGWPFLALAFVLLSVLGGIAWFLITVGFIEDHEYLYSDEH